MVRGIEAFISAMFDSNFVGQVNEEVGFQRNAVEHNISRWGNATQRQRLIKGVDRGQINTVKGF